MDTFINHSDESIYYSQNDFCLFFFLRGDSFSMYAKFSEKLKFLTSGYTHVRVSIRWKQNLSFSENFAQVLNE